MLHEWLVALFVVVMVLAGVEYLFHRRAVNAKFLALEVRALGLERKLSDMARSKL